MPLLLRFCLSLGSTSLWYSIDIDNFDISPSFSSVPLPPFLLHLSSLSSRNTLPSTPFPHMPFLRTSVAFFCFLSCNTQQIISKCVGPLLQTEALWLHSPHCSYQDHHQTVQRKNLDRLLTPSLCFLWSPHPAEWADGENTDTGLVCVSSWSACEHSGVSP